MTRVDMLNQALPYALPIALAAVTALLTPALVTPRRLRHDLAIDTEIVDRLPTQERADLNDDIKRRARHLIAVTRYPTLTLYDLLALLGLTGITAFVIFGHVLPASRAGDDALILDPLSAGIASLFGASCWAAFYVPWGTRAKSRLEHLLAHLGVDEARDAANTVRVAYLTALGAGVSAVVGMQVAIAVVTFEVTGTDYVPGWTARSSAACSACCSSGTPRTTCG